MNDMNWDDVKNDVRDLQALIISQNIYIEGLKQRLKDHGLTVVEKSPYETTREEVIAANKSIPPVRFKRANNPEKTKMSTPTEQYKAIEDQAKDFNPLVALARSLTDQIDLEKYGIGPVTLNFKPGWGPNGYTPPKLTFWQKIKRFFGGNVV